MSTVQYRCRGRAGRIVVIDDVPASLVRCDDGTCEVRVKPEVDKTVQIQRAALLRTLPAGEERRARYYGAQPSQAEAARKSIAGE